MLDNNTKPAGITKGFKLFSLGSATEFLMLPLESVLKLLSRPLRFCTFNCNLIDPVLSSVLGQMVPEITSNLSGAVSVSYK